MKTAKKQLHIRHAIIKRIKCRLLDEIQNNGCDQTTSEHSFGEGLSGVLSGLNAATTRNVISSTMAHLISCNNWSWFVFSHKFSDLFVRQMEATLEGQVINVRIRTSKVPGGELKCARFSCWWLHSQTSTKRIWRHLFLWHEKSVQEIYKSYKEKSIQTYEFSDSHSGYKVIYPSWNIQLYQG